MKYLNLKIFSLLLLLLLSRFSRVQLCVTPQTAAHQAPPSLGFSRQEHAQTCLLLFVVFFFFFNSDQILCSIKWRRHGMGLEQGAHILSMITLFQPLTVHLNSSVWENREIYLAFHPFLGGNRAWLANLIRCGKKITFRKIKTFALISLNTLSVIKNGKVNHRMGESICK